MLQGAEECCECPMKGYEALLMVLKSEGGGRHVAKRRSDGNEWDVEKSDVAPLCTALVKIDCTDLVH